MLNSCGLPFGGLQLNILEHGIKGLKRIQRKHLTFLHRLVLQENIFA